MKTIRTISAMRAFVAEAKKHRQTICFVPTMGALHEGHLSLVNAACQKGDIIVVSIFVNPLQFGPREDLARYPKHLNRDKKLLSSLKVDALFLPDPKEMYGQDFSTIVLVSKLSKMMCGASRPGHFQGVTTVLAKLFNIIQPDFSFFGEKDFQQQLIVKKMVADLNFPVEIISLPTVREFNGLVMSSRNQYLSDKEREAALILYKTLMLGKSLIEKGERSITKILNFLRKNIKSEPLARLEYLTLADPTTLEDLEKIKGDTVLAMAVWIGKTRLIDNLLIKL